MVGLVNYFGSLFAVVPVKKFTRRNLLIVGHIMIAGSHFLVGIFAQFNLHTLALVSILLFLLSFSTTDGPIGFMYAAEVVVDSALGLCYFALIGSILVLQLTTEFMMDSWLQPQGVFWLLSFISLIASVYCYFYVRDTTYLTDKEKKLLFTPAKYLEEKVENGKDSFESN